MCIDYEFVAISVFPICSVLGFFYNMNRRWVPAPSFSSTYWENRNWFCLENGLGASCKGVTFHKTVIRVEFSAATNTKAIYEKNVDRHIKR